MDPLDIKTVNKFAVFLHKKRGELARAEAFFLRGMQVCMPGFIDQCKAGMYIIFMHLHRFDRTCLYLFDMI